MPLSTNLGLDYLEASQSQKHVTVNETFRRLDAICQLSVISATTTAQPGSPADGSVYILPVGKTGAAWGPMTNLALGYYVDGAWEQITPKEGWRAYIKDTDLLVIWNGSGWAAITPTVASASQVRAQSSSTTFLTPLSLSQKAAFSANKNGTDQTGVLDGSASGFVKATFTTEAHDEGACYDTTNSRWTPPAGKVVIGACVNMFGTWAAGSIVFATIYKNGVRFKDSFPAISATANGNVVGVLCTDVANGTDYYEVYVYMDVTAATTGTIYGVTSTTYFFGYQM